MTHTTSKKKGRAKQTTDIGRSILKRERDRLVKEQARLAEKLAEDALRSRRLAAKAARKDPMRDEDRAVQRSIVRRCVGVLASEGVNASVKVYPIDDSASVKAWTDFSQISIGYHRHEDVRLTAAVLRGLFYHEGGHIRWSDPLPTIMSEIAMHRGWINEIDLIPPGLTRNELHRAWNGLEDQRMETAVCSDAPRKAGYFLPMTLSELCDTADHAADNWPLLVWRGYLPTDIVRAARRSWVFKQGENGETWARKIEQVVTRYVMATDLETLFAAVVDMAYIWQSVRPPAFNLADAGHTKQTKRPQPIDTDALIIPISPDMIPENGGDVDEDDDSDPVIDWQHIFEVLAASMMEPETLVKVVYALPSPSPAKSEQGAGEEEQEQGAGEGQQDSKDDDESQAGSKGVDKDDDSNEDDATGGKEQDDEGEPNRDHGGSTGEHTDDGSDNVKDDMQQMLDDALAQAEEDRLNDPALDEDVRSFAESKEDACSALDPYQGSRDDNPLVMAEAQNLSDAMVRAFEQATSDIAPTWHEQERRGVVNVLRYKTRQPGQVDFYRSYVDEGAPGCDIAVSLLLDYSLSMHRSVEALAKVAYACKNACDRLDVPCTVVLWDTNARVLWDAHERAEYVPVIKTAGGTNPAVALSDLNRHEAGKSKHLVLIMTDDAWNGDEPLLASHKQDGRTIFGLGYTDGAYAQDIAGSLERKGADYAYSITDLEQIPRFLERALVDLA